MHGSQKCYSELAELTVHDIWQIPDAYSGMDFTKMFKILAHVNITISVTYSDSKKLDRMYLYTRFSSYRVT